MKIKSALATLALLSATAAAQSQPPIRILFDTHVDPLPQGVSLSAKQASAQASIDIANWILDQLEPIGGQLSFLSVGEFMEVVIDQGTGSDGDLLLQRIYANGGQIASHSHDEARVGPFDWPKLPPGASYAQVVQSWQDNVDWVNAGILMALGDPPPEDLEVINSVRGSHLPKTEAEFQTIMPLFGFDIRQGGPEEDYIQWYDHYIFHPYRPSADNAMAEDLDGSFVVVPQGTTIGVAGVHHGIFQDMTAPFAKRRFLQTYLNWRHADRNGLPEKVWTFGWGSHPLDYQESDGTRDDLLELLAWLDDLWMNETDATGSTIAAWSTQRAVGEEYLAWETANPGVSSFSEDADGIDWGEYPWLRAVAEELLDTQYVASFSPGAGATGHHLRRGPLDVMVLWRDAGPAVVDLSGSLNSTVRVIGAETGLLLGTDPAAIPVGVEPVIVTEEAPSITVTGTPALGSTLTVRVQGQPGSLASAFLSTMSQSLPLPHLGEALIGPFPLLSVGTGLITNPAGLSLPLPIPTNPGLQGLTVHMQGFLLSPNGASGTLTVNAATVTVL